MSALFDLQTIYPDPDEYQAALKRLSDPETTKSYSIVETFRRDAPKEPTVQEPIKQAVCMWAADTEYGSDDLEREFKKFGLQELGLDWGYVGGRPMISVMTTVRLSDVDLTRIEYLMRSRGVKTWGGGIKN